MTDVTTPKKKRAALYIRVSSQEQVEKFGSKVQLNQMKKWLLAHDDIFTFDEKHIYTDDGYSGASDIDERKELPKLFKAAAKKEFDVVCVWKLDRFFRKTEWLLRSIRQLEEDFGIGFIATTQSEVNTTTTFGKFMLGLLGIIAEMERDLIVERTGAGRMQAADEGRFVGGMHTYGYDIDHETHKIAISPERSKVVRKIFNWFVRDRLNAYEIQQKLNALKIPTQADIEEEELRKKGKLKTSKRKKNPPCFWHTSTIRRVLKNEAYTGKYFYGKKTKKYDSIKKKKVEVLNPESDWIEITCAKIIDRNIWEDAAKLLLENEKTQKRSSHIYLLTGRIACGTCNSAFQGYLQTKTETKGGEKKVIARYPNYRCGRNNITKAGEPCRNRQISSKALEDLVWKEVHALLSNPAVFIKRIEEEEAKKDNVHELEEERDVKQKELESIISEYESVTTLYQKGLKYRGKGELEKETSRLLKQKKKLEDDLNAIASRLMDAEQKQERLRSAKVLAKRYAKDIDTLDFEMRKMIVQDLVKRVVVFDKKIRIELLIPKPPNMLGGRKQNETLYGVTGRD